MTLLKRRSALKIAMGTALSASALGHNQLTHANEPHIKLYDIETVSVEPYSPPYNNIQVGDMDSPTFQDIVEHSKDGSWLRTSGDGRIPSPAVRAHETVHGILIDALENYDKIEGYKHYFVFEKPNVYKIKQPALEGAYLGEGRIALVKSPYGIDAYRLKKHIPLILHKTGAFKDYFEKKIKNSLGNNPRFSPIGYLINEASAYALHSKVAMELHQHHKYYKTMSSHIKENETEVSGEFVFYLLALGRAAHLNVHAFKESKDRDQFYGIIQEMVKRLSEVYQEGQSPQYKKFGYSNPNYLWHLQNDNDIRTRNLRLFASEIYGSDWLNSLDQNLPFKDMQLANGTIDSSPTYEY